MFRIVRFVMFTFEVIRLTVHSSIRLLWVIIATITFLPATATPQVRESTPAIEPQPSSSAQQSSQISGRLHPAYQVFARQIALPSITATNNDVLVIGDTARLNMAHRDQMLAQLKPLSEQLGVPASALEAFLTRLKTNSQSSGQSAASEFRENLVDYKYLLSRWTQYRPPAGQETIKTNALQMLQAGNLEQAWRLFDSLQRPQPPGGFRVVGSN